MGGKELLTRRAASNVAAVKMDLAKATGERDEDRGTLLQTLLDCGGQLLVYRPELQHYAVLFGDIDHALHVAVVVPGVGDGTNLCADWIPGARNLYEAAASTAVAGSPGVTVDELRQLHVEQSHFFSEQAPGDVIAELGVFGASPSAPSFGGTRMSTNAPGYPVIQSHSRYFEPGSLALENMVAVVTGRYEDVVRHRSAFAEIVGGLVAWSLRMPVVPVRMAGRHYRGPGFRLLVNACRLVDVGASETGNVVCQVLDEGERAVLWVARGVGVLPPHPGPDAEVEPETA